MFREDPRKLGILPIPNDWKFRSSPRWLRSLMIQQGYAEFDRRKAEYLESLQPRSTDADGKRLSPEGPQGGGSSKAPSHVKVKLGLGGNRSRDTRG